MSFQEKGRRVQVAPTSLAPANAAWLSARGVGALSHAQLHRVGVGRGRLGPQRVHQNGGGHQPDDNPSTQPHWTMFLTPAPATTRSLAPPGRRHLDPSHVSGVDRAALRRPDRSRRRTRAGLRRRAPHTARRAEVEDGRGPAPAGSACHQGDERGARRRRSCVPWAPRSDVNLRSAPGSVTAPLPRIQGWAPQTASSQSPLHARRHQVRARPTVGVPVVGPGRVLGVAHPLPPVRECHRRRQRRRAPGALVGPAGRRSGNPVVFGSGRRGTRLSDETRNRDRFATSTPSAPEPGLAGGQSRRCRSIPGFGSARHAEGPEAVVGGVVYTGTSRQVFPTAIGGVTLDAFDAVSGDPVWTGTVPFSGGVFGPPAVAGGRVFVDYFFLGCLRERRVGGFATWDATTGEQGWIGELGRRLHRRPARSQ